MIAFCYWRYNQGWSLKRTFAAASLLIVLPQLDTLIGFGFYAFHSQNTGIETFKTRALPEEFFHQKAGSRYSSFVQGGWEDFQPGELDYELVNDAFPMTRRTKLLHRYPGFVQRTSFFVLGDDEVLGKATMVEYRGGWFYRHLLSRGHRPLLLETHDYEGLRGDLFNALFSRDD